MNITKQKEPEQEEEIGFPRQKIRGIRSLLKKSSSADYKKVHSHQITPNLLIKYDTNLQNEEVSFDITPDDEEILTSIASTNNNVVNDSYEEEKPFDALAITKIEKEESINTINSSQNQINHTTITTTSTKSLSNTKLNSINNRLLQKIKQVKSLEQELKEKNVLIERLKLKIKNLSSSKEDNNKSQNTSKVKNDLILNNKKLKEKENELEKKKLVLDNLVDNYKEKINNLINTNEMSLEKITKLENKIKVYKENESKFKAVKDSYEQKIDSLEKQLKNLNENFEYEIKEKTKIEEKNNEYTILLNKSLQVLMSLTESKKAFNLKENSTKNKIINLLKIFFSEVPKESDVINNNEENEFLNNDED